MPCLCSIANMVACNPRRVKEGGLEQYLGVNIWRIHHFSRFYLETRSSVISSYNVPGVKEVRRSRIWTGRVFYTVLYAVLRYLSLRFWIFLMASFATSRTYLLLSFRALSNGSTALLSPIFPRARAALYRTSGLSSSRA